MICKCSAVQHVTLRSVSMYTGWMQFTGQAAYTWWCVVQPAAHPQVHAAGAAHHLNAQLDLMRCNFTVSQQHAYAACPQHCQCWAVPLHALPWAHQPTCLLFFASSSRPANLMHCRTSVSRQTYARQSTCTLRASSLGKYVDDNCCTTATTHSTTQTSIQPCHSIIDTSGSRPWCICV